MKKASTILTFIIIPVLAYLQTNSPAVFETDSNYVSIPGTRISLDPPKGFVMASKFAGIKHPARGASILVAEMDKPLSAIQQGFTKEGFSGQGMDLHQSTKLFIGFEECLLYKATKTTGEISFSKWIIIFGDDSSSVMISGTFPDSFETELSRNIENCLLSAHFNPYKKILPELSLGFRINTEGSCLKFAKSFPGTLVYTEDGTYPNQNPGGVIFKVGSSLGKVIVENPKSYAIDLIQNLPYKLENEYEIAPVYIDNLSGYEILAHGTEDISGRKLLIYQVLLFSNSSYYRIVGTAFDNFKHNHKLFKDLAGTFKQNKR